MQNNTKFQGNIEAGNDGKNSLPSTEFTTKLETISDDGKDKVDTLIGQGGEDKEQVVWDKRLEKEKIAELEELPDEELRLLLKQKINIHDIYETTDDGKIKWKNLVYGITIDNVYVSYKSLNLIIKKRFLKDIEKYTIFVGNGAKVKAMGAIAYFTFGIDYIFDNLEGKNIDSDKYFLELMSLDYQDLNNELGYLINIKDLYLANFIDKEIELEGHMIRIDKLYNLLVYKKENNKGQLLLNKKFSSENLNKLGIKDYKEWQNKGTLAIAYLLFGGKEVDKFYNKRPEKAKHKNQENTEFSINIPSKTLVELKKRITDYTKLFNKFGDLITLNDIYQEYGIYFAKRYNNNINIHSYYEKKHTKSSFGEELLYIDIKGTSANVPGDISDIIIEEIASQIWGKEFYDYVKIILEKRSVFVKAINGTLDYTNKNDLKLVFGNLDDLLGDGYGKDSLHYQKIKVGNSVTTLGQVWFDMRLKLNIETQELKLSDKTSRFLAEYLYGNEATERINNYKEKSQKEFENYKQKSPQKRKPEIDYSVYNEKCSIEKLKEDLYNNLSKEHKEYLSFEDILDIDKAWLINYKKLHIVKIKYIVGELEEDIIDYSSNELIKFQQMSLKDIQKYFE